MTKLQSDSTTELSAVITMPKKQIDTILKSTGSQIAYCKFQKRDGSIRKMYYKTIAKKYIKGENGKGPAYDAKEKELTPVYDVKAAGIRSIRWDSVLEIGVKGQRYNFIVLDRNSNPPEATVKKPVYNFTEGSIGNHVIS